MAHVEYREAVNKLAALKNIETPWDYHTPKALRDSLERMRQLLRRLGNPEKKMRFVHVTGTSGKGSVTNLVHEMLLADGRKVASYTSPHTTTYLERFRVGEKLIEPKKLAVAINVVLDTYEAHLRAGNQPLTFLELSTCMALLAFAQAKIDWCVMEVGLGGRWDSTNVIPAPAVAVITNIDLDHTQVLGNTRQKIAHEKAGIIKKGSHVVIGEPRRNLRALFAKEAERTGADIEYVRLEGDDHRLHNALIATRAALAVDVPLATIERALTKYRSLPCRLEIMQEKPRVILDGAHNEAKMTATVERMRQLAKGKVHVIFACGAAKHGKRMLELASSIAATVRTTRFQHKDKSPSNPFTLEKLVAKKLRAGAYLFAHDALTDALAKAKPSDTILVTGSLCLAGELRTRWVTEEDILRTRSSYLS